MKIYWKCKWFGHKFRIHKDTVEEIVTVPCNYCAKCGLSKEEINNLER